MRDVRELIETRLPLEADEVSSPLVNHVAVKASEAASPVTVKNMGTGRKDRSILFLSRVKYRISASDMAAIDGILPYNR
jgi:hypothetical protein